MLNLTLAWRNLWRQPRRTWLTTGAMIFANILLVFMICLQFGMYRMMIENNLRLFTGHLQVQAAGYNDEARMYKSLDHILPLAQRLRQQLGMETLAARAYGFALVSSEQRSAAVQIMGVEPDYEQRLSSLPGLVKQGRYLGDLKAGEALIGETLARNLKVQLGDELTLLGSGRDGSFAADVLTIVGIFSSGVADMDRSVMQMPLLRFQDTFFMEGGGHAIVVMGQDFFTLSELRARLTALLEGEADAVVLDWRKLMPGLEQSIQADMVSSWFMYGVLVLLVAFSVLNTQLMSVLERTREFGIVMALGLRPGRLGRLVMLETALMGVMGLVIGTALGAALVLYLGHYGFTMPGMEEAMAQYNLPTRVYPSTSAITILIGPLVIFLASLVASLYPALRLQFLQPVQAMRAV